MSHPTNVSILVVEDLDEMRILLSEMIKGIPGFRVSGTARNTVEARVEILQRRPDVVLLDEILPGESAWDFLEVIVTQGLKVILMTGLGEERPVPPSALGRVAKPSWDTLKEDQSRFRDFVIQVLQKSKA